MGLPVINDQPSDKVNEKLKNNTTQTTIYI